MPNAFLEARVVGCIFFQRPKTLPTDREPMDAFRLLSVSVTPVVLISACGLITLALYNRLSAILARIRTFYHQKFELLECADKHNQDGQKMLLEMIDSQITRVTGKAKAIKNGLYCLRAAVIAFLICSMLGAGAALHESIGMIALGMHVVGLFLFVVGIAWAIRELVLSLTPLEEERAYLEVLTARNALRSQPAQVIDVVHVV